MSIIYANGFDQLGKGPANSGTGSSTGGGDGEPWSPYWVGTYFATEGWVPQTRGGGPGAGAVDVYAIRDNTPDGEGTAIMIGFAESLSLPLPRSPSTVILSLKAWSDNTAWEVFALCWWALGSASFDNAFQYQAEIVVNADGSVTVNCDTNVPEVNSHWAVYSYTTAPGLIEPGTWHRYEIYYDCDLANGTIVLRVDGLTQISLYSVPTVSNVTGELPDTGFTPQINMIQLFGSGSIGNRILYDDMIVVDPTDGVGLCDFPGRVRVGAIPVAKDAGPNQMTPSTGTEHFACVNTFPDTEGVEWSPPTPTYLTANAANQSEVFGFGPLPSDAMDILAVIPCVRAKGDGTAGVQATVALGGEEFATTPFVPPSANYAGNPQTVMEIDPLGGSWTVREFPNASMVVISK